VVNDVPVVGSGDVDHRMVTGSGGDSGILLKDFSNPFDALAAAFEST